MSKAGKDVLKGVAGIRMLRDSLAADIPAFAEAVATRRRADSQVADLRRQLRDRRIAMNLDQQAMADRMGVSQSAISKIENGTGDLGYRTIYRYAAALGVEPVLGFSDENWIFAEEQPAEAQQVLIAGILERARQRMEEDLADISALNMLESNEAPAMPYRAGPLFMPSKDLARITGADPLPRSQFVSKIWDHIKKNNLQNPANKQEILADDRLRKVFGSSRVSMFDMNKHLSRHLSDTDVGTGGGRKGGGARGNRRGKSG